MSFISRGIKVGSGTTAFAAPTTILSAEVNTDFDTLYNDYNGNISNANVALAAAIAYAKLNLASSIVDADISASAGINGTKLANASIVGSVKLSNLSVPIGKLTVGAAVNTTVSATDNGNPTGIGFATETIILEGVAGAASRGGTMFIQVGLNGGAGVITNQAAILTITLRSDGTAGVVDGTVVASARAQANFVTDIGVMPFAITMPLLFNTVNGTTHRFKVTAQTDNINVAWSMRGGFLRGIEFA